jgi:NitT/TauT family transport system substrate-binding protein
MRPINGTRFVALVAFLMALLLAPVLSLGSSVSAQTPTALNCNPATTVPATPASSTSTAAAPVVTPPADAVKVTMGYVPALIFAPVMIAKDKGYFAEQGLNVNLQALGGGSDIVAQTATGQFDAAIGGAGPGFFNAISSGLPLTVIAPGHAEGNPVATPLMISKAACESGAITSVADLKGKKVSVNAPGSATEYWLSQALGIGGLKLSDIDLQTLPFPDAVVALGAGAIDAAMIGEPYATMAEQQGLAVRLATDFPVQGIQPTVVFANDNFLKDHPDAAKGLVTAYLKASRELANGGLSDPTDLAILESYTHTSAAVLAAAVHPIYPADGKFDLAGLQTLQTFFRQLGVLEYDTDLDPASFVDTQYVAAAIATLGNP